MSTHGAGDEPSRFDGRWRAVYTTSPSAFYEMEFSGDRFSAVQGEAWYKGELVIGAGIDGYVSYAQRGSFPVIEHQMGALVELFPSFSRLRMLRT